jgi:choline dehydrogenase
MHHLANVATFILLSLVSSIFSSSYCLSFIDATYDYVVIGGGTSGLAIAAKLAANSSVSVALVEASGYYEILNSALY